jgi:hypothetical protein
VGVLVALQKTQIGFPFLKGINQKPSEKSQAAGELTDCKNFRMDKTGRLDRRFGFDRYPKATVAVGDTSAGTIETTKAMAHLGDEILVYDGEEVFSKTTDDKWVKRADVLNVRSESKFINRDVQSTSGTLSYAISGNYEYLAWAEQPYNSDGDGNDIGEATPGNTVVYKYMVRDRHTGATIVPTTELADSLDTSVLFDGAISNASSTTVTGTGFPHRTFVGNYVHVSSDAGAETTKHLVDAATATTLTLSSALSLTHTSNVVMQTYKDTGGDSLFWAPRLRLLTIPGTPHVFLIVQQGKLLRYYSATTANGTHANLQLVTKGTLHTFSIQNGAYPAWDADWLLTSDTAYTFLDDVSVVLFTTGFIEATVRQFQASSAATPALLASVRTVDVQAEDSYYSNPNRFLRGGASGLGAGENPTQKNWVAQPFVKVLHSVDANGAPLSDRLSRIIVGYNSEDVSANKYPQIYCCDDEIAVDWGSKIYTTAGTGIAETLCLARAGVVYDGTSAHIMAEMHSDDATDLYQPQKTHIVYAKFTVSSGARTEERGLWSNASIQSDGFIPPGSATDKCYWWVSMAQPTSIASGLNTYASPSDLSLNSITFLADQTGKIQAHGVKGNAGLNSLLEYRSMEQGAEEGPSRNMQCMVSRITEGRWATAGSTEFWCGGSMADLGATYGVLTHAQPALLKWDTNPYRPFRSESAHGVLYTCGGLLWSYDGNRFVESEFLLSPVIQNGYAIEELVTPLPTGKYVYYVTYEFQDDEGVKHISPPAGPIEVDIDTATKRAELFIALSQATNHRFSGKDGNPGTYSVNIYRSNTDGTVHYLHDTIEANAWGDSFSPTDRVINYTDIDSTQHSIFSETLVWDAVPAQLAGNPISSPVDIARHKDSLMISNTENILYSSLGLIPGFGATFPGVVAENAGAYALYGDAIDSPITHIASNGPSFLFFTKDAIYGLDGEGPNSTGVGTWSRPVKVSEGQGVRPGGFIAETPLGVLYSSQNGIYIAGRDLQIVNVGAAVDDYSRFDSANDPLVFDLTNEVLIPLWGGDPDDLSGAVNRTALVFNYYFKAWYRIELSKSFMDGHSVEWHSWVDANNNVVLYLCDSDGYLYKYKDTSSTLPYGDTYESASAIPVSCSAETSWIQFPDYGGKMRVYRMMMLGTYDPASSGDTTTLELSSSTNFNGSASNETFTSTVTATGIGADNSQGSSEIVMKPAQQKAESLRVSFTMASGSAGKGWSPEGLLFEVGQRPSATRFKVDSDKQAS